MMNSDVEYLVLGNEQIVRVSGHIDFTNSFKLAQALIKTTTKQLRTVVDLSLTESIDSQALHILMSAFKQAKKAGVEMVLTSPPQNVMRVIQLTGIESVFGLPASLPQDDLPILVNEADLRRQDWRITESVACAEPELMTSLKELAMTAAIEMDFDEAIISDIRIAVTEALANALKHGSLPENESKVKLQCMVCPKAYVIEVSDEGDGVGLETLKGIGTSSCEEMLGLRLMLSAMDEVDFLRDDRGSRVRMIKWSRKAEDS